MPPGIQTRFHDAFVDCTALADSLSHAGNSRFGAGDPKMNPKGTLHLSRLTIDSKPASLLACAAAILFSAHVGFARPAAHSSHSSAAHQAKLAHLQAQNQALASGNAVQAAYAFRGTRYVMGGTSRSGFDCSGFVRYILGATNGVDLPRTATEQYYHGAPVPNAQLQPGDLVFFKNTYKRGISHVGIYAGAGRFIHAANPHRGVQMDSLNSTYYAHHFAGARRVLPLQMRAMAALPQ